MSDRESWNFIIDGVLYNVYPRGGAERLGTGTGYWHVVRTFDNASFGIVTVRWSEIAADVSFGEVLRKVVAAHLLAYPHVGMAPGAYRPVGTEANDRDAADDGESKESPYTPILDVVERIINERVEDRIKSLEADRAHLAAEKNVTAALRMELNNVRDAADARVESLEKAFASLEKACAGYRHASASLEAANAALRDEINVLRKGQIGFFLTEEHAKTLRAMGDLGDRIVEAYEKSKRAARDASKA